MRFVVLGGNGFVGTEIAKRLVAKGVTPACISRSGVMPRFLKQSDWAKQAEWIRAEDAQRASEAYNNADGLICLVGSPPVPTFSSPAYERQLYQNSQPNLQAIEQAINTDIRQLVLLGAHLPNAINNDRFAYAKGKQLCLEKAQLFADSRPTRGAVVLQPTAIFGTRHTAKGTPINLGLAMRPFSRLQGILPATAQRCLPEQFVSVEAVAEMAVRAALEESYAGKFSVISNQEIAAAMSRP